MILRRELTPKAQDIAPQTETAVDSILRLYGPNFSIYDEDDALFAIKRAMNELGIDTKKFNPRAVKSFIEGAKNELLTPSQYEPLARGYFNEHVAKVYRRYQAILQAANAMDFDDIIMNVVLMFQKNPEILRKYQEQFRYVMVDEYQDTNHAQYSLIGLLAANHHNLCVVGDDYQSIYSWRGADFRNILNFEKDYPDATVIKLEQNYRSTKTILDAANHIIRQNTNRTDKKLWTENSQGLPITVLEAESDDEEAHFIVQEIRSLTDQGERYSDIAVLYRTNAQSRGLEETFIRQGIPYRLIGAVRFYERKEIKDVLAYLRYLTNPSDLASLQRIINLPPRGIGEKTFEKALDSIREHSNQEMPLDTLPPKVGDFFVLIDKLHQAAGLTLTDSTGERTLLGPAEVIEMIVRQTGYKDYINDGTLEGESRWENIEELIAVASHAPSIDSFLEDVSLVADIDNYNPDEEAVIFMTLHSAKGLEFPTVFMIGMEEGIFPHSRSLMDSSQMEEERRLCYVGMTRAKERLYLLHASRRMGWGGLMTNPRSRFLEELPAELLDEI
jgi:DNA helicase-2/ATP-dependent DNA helicase PcrA